MTIAMVPQSQIDDYLNRIERFSQSVKAFAQRLDAMMAARTPDNITPEYAEPVSEKPSYMKTDPLVTADYASKPVTESVVTPDDVDIDAILDSIDLDNPMTY